MPDRSPVPAGRGGRAAVIRRDGGLRRQEASGGGRRPPPAAMMLARPPGSGDGAREQHSSGRGFAGRYALTQRHLDGLRDV